jgi:hypothetical protein
MTTIPASQIVSVTPSVLEAGGATLDVIALALTTSTRVPIGSVLSFPTASAVEDFFGPNTDEASFAATYFAGFSGANRLPGSMLFAQYNDADVAAYLRTGDLSVLTLAQLQALSGSLVIALDGVTFTVPSVSLSAATSFSSGADIIESALAGVAPSTASVTGSIGGVVTASAGAEFTGTGSGTNLTVASISGVLHPGAQLSGTGIPSGTYIVSQTSGTAGSNGVYVTNHATTSSGDAIVATSNTLDVTAVSSGTVHATDVVSGTGVTAGTTIVAQLSGSPGGIGLYVINSFQQFDSVSVTSLSSVLNVTAVGSGTLEVGALLAGTNVTSGTVITAQGTGSGGTGTYTLSDSSTTVSETITASAAAPTVTYDSVSGAFVIESGTTGATSSVGYASGTIAAGIKATLATGATLSQGADEATPASAMNDIINITTDWVTFTTIFDPDATDENTVRQAFADWKNDQNNRYAYICWDTDITATESVPATGSLGYILANNNDSGTCLVYGPDEDSARELAAFVCGAAASIDFTERNGRITFASKGQDGITGTVTDATIAANLGGLPQTANRGNGYNFYGAYGAANTNFIWFQRGFVTGDFAWLDSYINQIWLNNEMQIALLTLMQNARSIPYNTAGYAKIEAALADPIQAGLNFGALAPGAISSAQIAEVNSAAGASIANNLQTQGYYLQIQPASSASRAARTTPPCKFWYLDRGSIQAINLASIAVQ